MSGAPESAEGGFAYRLLRRVTTLEPAEAQVVLWCWLYIFAVMSSYYIMRPIRDQVGVAGGVKNLNLQWLFTATLIGMLALNLPFAYLVKTLPRSRFIPLTYRFFAVNILLFVAALHVADPEQTVWVGRVFFVWVSIYNLFVVSIFWQMNADLFRPEQAKRLFGFIAAGATIGRAMTAIKATRQACVHHFSRPAGLARAPSLTAAHMIQRRRNGTPSSRMACRKMPSASIRLMRPEGTYSRHR